MVAGTDLIVDAEARADHAFTALELFGILGADAALAGELAFAVGDNHLQTTLAGLPPLLERLHPYADALGADPAQPVHTPSAPMPRQVCSMSMPAAEPARLVALEGMYCWPVAEE